MCVCVCGGVDGEGGRYIKSPYYALNKAQLTCSGSHVSAGSMPVLLKNSDHGRLQKVAPGES